MAIASILAEVVTLGVTQKAVLAALWCCCLPCCVLCASHMEGRLKLMRTTGMSSSLPALKAIASILLHRALTLQSQGNQAPTSEESCVVSLKGAQLFCSF